MTKSIQIILFVLSPYITVSWASFSIMLPPGEEECFVLRVPRRRAIISGSFDVLEEELIPDPVQARLEDSKKVLWFSNVGEEEGMFEIQVDEGGLHRFCLENGKHLESDGYDRRIGFSLRVRSLQEIRSLQDEEGPDEERALQLVEWARDLEDSWANLLDHYEFLKAREDLHKRLTEQTLSRVIRWTFLEGVALTLIALGQVMYLRKFMETRQFL